MTGKTVSVVRQCQLLGVCRASVYRQPVHRQPVHRQPVHDNAADLALKALIDRQHLEMPYYGSRKIAAALRQQGHRVNRKRVQRLMREMGLEAIYRKPRTSQPNPDHKVYPYLLRGVTVDRPNQVWAADITYIPMPQGFLYLVAVQDWYSRKVLSWRLSNTMDTAFCVAALHEALDRFGRPDIFNTDQGSQFTSVAFTGVLEAAGVRISRDGKGRCMDNVFVERLWRSLKYEDIYLKAYATGSEARVGIGGWFATYNSRRLHEALGYRTPAAVYESSPPAGAGHAQRQQAAPLAA